MIDAYLIPEATTVNAAGDGNPMDISSSSGKVFLLTLHITQIIEQEALDISVWGSADGNAWGEKSLAAFPQKFYVGKHPLLLDLGSRPEIKMLRAHWNTNRWGRGTGIPMFELHLAIREVPIEVLRETRTPVGA